MKLRIFACVFATACLGFLAGCGAHGITPDENGVATAQTGQTLRAADRDFVVVSALPVEGLGSYTPLAGEQLVDVVIKTTNRRKGELIITDVDYQLQWGTDGFADPLVAFQSEQMAPLEFTLEKGESAEYHYLYSVPAYTAAFSVCHLGQNQDERAALFYSSFSL